MFSIRNLFRQFVVIQWCATCLALSGCGEIEWLWVEPQSVKNPRSNRPIAPTQKPGPSNKIHQQDLAKQETIAMSADSNDQATFYQLILHGKPASTRTQPGMKHIHLKHASARDVGELLSILYLPAGPTGTEERYTLIYTTTHEWGASADWASELDILAINDINTPPPENVDNAFAYGIGLIYGMPADLHDHLKRFQLARAELLRVLQSTDQPKRQRWAAGMVAGWITANRFCEYEQAEKYYASAEAVTQPGGLEQMVTIYARAGAFIQEGKPDVARKLLHNMIAQFGVFRRTEVYERAAKTLADLN